MRPVGMLGVPSNSSGRADGVARSAAVLREAGLVDAIGELAEITDYGDVSLPEPVPKRDPDTHLVDPVGFVAVVTRVRDAIATILKDGRFPLVIGGDCPLLLGCLIAARAAQRVGLLFVDGHEDGYTPERSSTGEAADTELAFALGVADATWSPELAEIMPILVPADVVILGARDAAVLRAEGVPTLADLVAVIDDEGVLADPSGVTERARSALSDPWWFHLDLDVLSTRALPAVDYPQAGGLGWDELLLVASTALEGGPAGWDITIYNPDLDPDRRQARRIVRFVASVIGAAGI
jgi:arginase